MPEPVEQPEPTVPQPTSGPSGGDTGAIATASSGAQPMTAEEVTFTPPTLDDAFTFAQHGPMPKDLTGYFQSAKALHDFGPYLRRHHIHPHTSERSVQGPQGANYMYSELMQLYEELQKELKHGHTARVLQIAGRIRRLMSESKQHTHQYEKTDVGEQLKRFRYEAAEREEKQATALAGRRQQAVLAPVRRTGQEIGGRPSQQSCETTKKVAGRAAGPRASPGQGDCGAPEGHRGVENSHRKRGQEDSQGTREPGVPQRASWRPV